MQQFYTRTVKSKDVNNYNVCDLEISPGPVCRGRYENNNNNIQQFCLIINSLLTKTNIGQKTN